jgi:cytochrome c553
MSHHLGPRRLCGLGLLLLPMLAAAQAPVASLDAGVQAALEIPADRARGEAAFVDCVACHRKDGVGRPVANVPRVAGQHAQVIIKQVLDIRSGRRINETMKPIVDDPAFTPQILADIAAYLQALPVPGPITKGPGTALARGKVLYEQSCIACHGADGEGQPAAFRPMVAAQHYGYLLRELKRIQSGERGNSDPTMSRLMQSLSPEDMQAVADHMSRLPPTRP